MESRALALGRTYVCLGNHHLCSPHIGDDVRRSLSLDGDTLRDRVCLGMADVCISLFKTHSCSQGLRFSRDRKPLSPDLFWAYRKLCARILILLTVVFGCA